MSILRRLRALSIITLPVIGLFVAPVPAQAQPLPPILNCIFEATVTFDPGISVFSVEQDIGGEVRLGDRAALGIDCTSLSLPIVGGETVGSKLDGSGEFACIPSVGAFGGATGTITVEWYDGNGDPLGTSVAEWSAAVQGIAPVATIEVVGGTYAPLIGTDVVLTSVVPTSLNGNCLLNPVVALGFTANSVFVPLPI